MASILNGDFYRIGKSKLLYGVVVAVGVIAFFLVSIISQDIRLGISIFGDLTAFRSIEDIVRIGFEYHKGLGIFVSVLLSVFIGQEYQWNTWQHKWMISKSRSAIYMSKTMISALASATVFLLFESIVLLGSGQIGVLLTAKYAATVVCGVFLYSALGTVICTISMLIRNSTASSITCLCYVVFSETFVSVIKNTGNAFPSIGKVIEWLTAHSVYGISATIASSSFQSMQMIPILLNAVVIMLLSTAVGLLVFRKYEL